MAEGGGRAGALRRLAAVGAGVLLLVVAASSFDVPLLLRRSLDWVAGLGPAGVIAFIAIYVLACVFMLPGSVLTLGAGAVFGVVKGSAIVSVAATLGRQEAGRTPAQWALYGVGLVATIAVTVFVTRIARAALAKKV